MDLSIYNRKILLGRARHGNLVFMIIAIFAIFVTVIVSSTLTSSLALSPAEIVPISCPSRLHNGERGEVSYVIENAGSQTLNLIGARTLVDRRSVSNESGSLYIPLQNTTSGQLKPNSEIASIGKFVSKENGIHYVDLLLSYSTENSGQRIDEYHEICKIDVIQDMSNTSPQIEGSMNSIIAAAGAIAGGSVGSYFTYRYGKRIEDRKAKREDTKESEYFARIKDLVYNELNQHLTFVSKLVESFPKQYDDFGRIDKNQYDNYKVQLEALPNQYDQLGIDIRAKSFTGETLRNLETSYKHFKELKNEIINQKGAYHYDIAKDLEKTITDTLGLIKNENPSN